MSRVIDLTGKRYGRLLVIDRAPTPERKQAYWSARCDCGTKKVIRGNHLRRGVITSCGCYHKERASRLNFIHGMKNTETYACWKGMMHRCYVKSSTCFKNYGARGITVCDRWKDFRLFLQDMGHRPIGLTLERIDNNKGYSPDNCKWATRVEQANNTRITRYISFNGLTLSPAIWSKKLGLPTRCVSIRLRNGWSIEKALTRPARKFNGRSANVRRNG